MYTINGNLMHMDRDGNYIMHGAKGSEWKTHKYVDKILKNGKWVYTYAKNKTSQAARTLKGRAIVGFNKSGVGKEIRNFTHYKTNKKNLGKIEKKIGVNSKLGDYYFNKFSKEDVQSVNAWNKGQDAVLKARQANKRATTFQNAANNANEKAAIARTDKIDPDLRRYLEKNEDGSYTQKVSSPLAGGPDKEYKKYSDEVNKYGSLAEKNKDIVSKKEREANAWSSYSDALYKDSMDAFIKARKYNKVANDIESGKNYQDLKYQVENSKGGKAAKKVENAVNKINETKKKVSDTVSKTASSAKSKVKETTDNVKKKTKETASKVKGTAVSTANKAVKTADKVATKATDEFVSRIIDSMERANVKKAEVKPAEVKPITLKENILKENILKENVLKENVIGEKKRKKKR